MNKILSIGSQFPEFKKKAVVSIEMGKEFKEISFDEHIKAKK
jgi:peroxiredoxin (alkyl hydroperoxide reductase subunit C)